MSLHFKLPRQQIVEVCQILHRKKMLAAADGNVSVRVSDQEILITPSGVSKAFISPDEICVIDINNKVLQGNPSGERLMHLEVYKQCPEARAVVHAHPATAIAWSVAYPDLKELPSESLSEVILAAGRIPFVPYARPGTIDMGKQLHPFLKDSRAMILSRHGALTWGETLMEAYCGMERIEHSAEILWKAQCMNELSKLPPDEVAHLREMRRQTGNKLL